MAIDVRTSGLGPADRMFEKIATKDIVHLEESDRVEAGLVSHVE